ncbi:hypothetical protein [Kibdelosporangium aridum]|uniref:Uncharacterized protein n=1 Tax=Kibdelosporangium aridum TaxID=2030 RepID=A0A1W2DTT7_KIBAR|nr:hypothetical protein [Kibdelosporangium aridum]SMD00432.1 hypothetical protein SAMN05661093_03798 [Kibdelosporangium aridum]
MSTPGYLFKVFAGLIGAFTLIGLGYDIENGRADSDSWLAVLVVGTVAAWLAVLGHKWHEPESVRDCDVADRPGTRRFRPPRQPEWLPHEAWFDFPDPLPDVPDVTGVPETDVPVGDVPPDHTLRRLWLVRAQLAAHLDPKIARSRKKFPGAEALAIASVGLAVCAALALIGAEQQPGDRFVLGPLLACGLLLWPFARCLLHYTEGFTLAAKRKRALEYAEARLMEMDRKRPGGPLGGPAVQAGEFPYVPPSVPPGRLP